jgi:hypothetical protein
MKETGGHRLLQQAVKITRQIMDVTMSSALRVG